MVNSEDNLQMEHVFESERIFFVNVTTELLDDYLKMINDIDRVARFIGHRTEPYTAEEEAAFIKSKIAENAPIFSMIEKDSGEFIGNIEFMDIKDGAAELGIAITAEKQGFGYGIESINRMLDYGFHTLALNRVFLKVYPDNSRAVHVYEKCGFSEYDRTDEDIFMEIQKGGKI